MYEDLIDLLTSTGEVQDRLYAHLYLPASKKAHHATYAVPSRLLLCVTYHDFDPTKIPVPLEGLTATDRPPAPSSATAMAPRAYAALLSS